MVSKAINGRLSPKVSIPDPEGDPSVPPPMISLPVWGRNGLQPPIEDKITP